MVKLKLNETKWFTIDIILSFERLFILVHKGLREHKKFSTVGLRTRIPGLGNLLKLVKN